MGSSYPLLSRACDRGAAERERALLAAVDELVREGVGFWIEPTTAELFKLELVSEPDDWRQAAEESLPSPVEHVQLAFEGLS